MEITPEILSTLTYKLYRKTAPVKLRQLTKEDYVQRKGVILSLEGPEKFQPGDYLAKGVLDEEWVFSGNTIASDYKQTGEKDAEGFTFYRPLPIVRCACQMLEPFTVKRPNGLLLKGKSGDYLIHLGDRARIVDRAVFELSYELVKEQEVSYDTGK